MRELNGRTVLIAGNSRGLSPYIAQALSAEGVNLLLAAQSEDNVKHMSDAISATECKAVCVKTDFEDEKSVLSLLKVGLEEFGAIDVLVNNSIIEVFCEYHKLTPQEIDHIVRVSLMGPMLLTMAVLPVMLRQRSGHIANICSLAGKAGPPYSETYTVSNAGLIAFTKSLRVEYARAGVSASAICPGFIDTDIYQRLRADAKLDAPRFMGISKPEKIGQAVVLAIKKDIPEIIVNPHPTRILTAIAELSPRTGEWVMRKLGIVKWFEKAIQPVSGDRKIFYG